MFLQLSTLVIIVLRRCFNLPCVSECSNFELPGQRLSYRASRGVSGARDAADCEEQCLQQTRWLGLVSHVWRLASEHLSSQCG